MAEHSAFPQNRIPDNVIILGSYRTFDIHTTNIIDITIKDCLDKVVEKHIKLGEEFFCFPYYRINILHSCPFLVNDPMFTNAVNSKLQESFPEIKIYQSIEKTFASEDFASYLQILPGISISLGTRNKGKKITEINHSCTFDIDEEILIIGTKIFYAISRDFLKDPEKYLNSKKTNLP